MSNPADNPTIEFYGHLDKAFKFFNERLFDGELPKVMFELTNKKNVGGFFKSKSWQAVDGTYVHTIAVNPQYIVNSTPVELYGILVHEQTHMWQHLYGDEGRGNYHNKEWAEKMESIGLMPSDTGKPGGKKTGQTMSDYPIPGGLFDQACIDFILEGNYINFVDASIDEAEVLKFRNQLISECAKKGESLADHYNNFFEKKNSFNSDVVNVSLDSLVSGYDDPEVKEFDVDSFDSDDDSDEIDGWDDSDDLDEIEDFDEHNPIKDLYLKELAESVERFKRGEPEPDYKEDIFDSTEPVYDPETAYRLEDEYDDLGIEDDIKDKLDSKMALLVNSPIESVTSSPAIQPKEEAASKNKVTYQCECCKSKVWGKPNLNIMCADCEEYYIAQ